MDDYELLLIVAWMSCFIVLRRAGFLHRRVHRRWWVRPLNQQRSHQGDYYQLFQQLQCDETMLHRYIRMDLQTFHQLLGMVYPHLLKRSHRALPPEHRLLLALRYFATGDVILSVALAYRVGESTVRKIIKEVSQVLVQVLAPIYLRQPNEQKWQQICVQFLQQWNFPNCCGAIDGKHVLIQAPANSGSLFYNYKKSFSIVLLAACDANYKFTLVHVGEMGSHNDAGIFADSPMGQALKNRQLGLPNGMAMLPGSQQRTPCFFVGDEAFGLSTNVMRPYAGLNLSEDKRIFNYRLSRARRTIENAFGISSARWRIYRKPINLRVDSVDAIILATIYLHNFLKTRDEAENPPRVLYCPPRFADWEHAPGVVNGGQWRQIENEGLRNIAVHRIQNEAQNALRIRDVLKDYFVTPEGEVPWQYDYVRWNGHI